jgi:hypothetical protein
VSSVLPKTLTAAAKKPTEIQFAPTAPTFGEREISFPFNFALLLLRDDIVWRISDHRIKPVIRGSESSLKKISKFRFNGKVASARGFRPE